MSLTRAVLRFGKPLPVIKGIIDRFREHEKNPVRCIFWKTVSDLVLIAFYFTDHPLYFHNVGLIPLHKKTVDWLDFWNNFTWLLGCIIDIFCDVVELYFIQKEILQIMKANPKAAENNECKE